MELKPVRCGCGGEAEPYAWVSGSYSCHCLSCGIETTNFKTPEEAVKAWNRAMGNHFREVTKKIEQTAKVFQNIDGYRCSKCFYKFETTAIPQNCPKCGSPLDWSE